MNGNNHKPLVGVALIIMRLKKNEVLMGRRKGSLGARTWAPPGGLLEHYEVARETALRETLEETSLTDQNLRLIDEHPHAITEDLFKQGLHYITLYLRAEYLSGTPRVMEPDKCEKWKWYRWDHLPTPGQLFLPVRNLVKLGYNPFTI